MRRTGFHPEPRHCPEDPTDPVTPTPTPVVPQTFYTTSSGDVSENEGILTSNQANSIAYRSDGITFMEGTISCDINLNGNTQDNGIIFGLINENDLTRFWEDEGIHYYFFFISASKRRAASPPWLQAHGPVMHPPGHDITSTNLPGHLPVFA